MSRLTFAPAAAADIDAVWDYTLGKWGADQADQYTDDIQAVSESLARGDKRGRDVDVRAGYLKYPVGRHYVLFRATDDGIEVIRILHQRMDVGRHL